MLHWSFELKSMLKMWLRKTIGLKIKQFSTNNVVKVEIEDSDGNNKPLSYEDLKEFVEPKISSSDKE